MENPLQFLDTLRSIPAVDIAVFGAAVFAIVQMLKSATKKEDGTSYLDDFGLLLNFGLSAMLSIPIVILALPDESNLVYLLGAVFVTYTLASIAGGNYSFKPVTKDDTRKVGEVEQTSAEEAVEEKLRREGKVTA